jgi:hypothetical protein
MDSLAGPSKCLDSIRYLFEPFLIQRAHPTTGLAIVEIRHVGIQRRTRFRNDQECFGFKHGHLDSKAKVAKVGEMRGDEVDVGDECMYD